MCALGNPIHFTKQLFMSSVHFAIYLMETGIILHSFHGQTKMINV